VVQRPGRARPGLIRVAVRVSAQVNPSLLQVGVEQRLGCVGAGPVMVSQGSRGYRAVWGGEWAGDKKKAGGLWEERIGPTGLEFCFYF
jgi:hypothetical protein